MDFCEKIVPKQWEIKWDSLLGTTDDTFDNVEVKVHCFNGYKLVGPEYLKCLAPDWYGRNNTTSQWVKANTLPYCIPVVQIDECQSDPCQNGGVCVDGVSSWRCDCPSGFKGLTCGTAYRSTCLSNPCARGTCVDKNETFTCECPWPFKGDICHEPSFDFWFLIVVAAIAAFIILLVLICTCIALYRRHRHKLQNPDLLYNEGGQWATAFPREKEAEYVNYGHVARQGPVIHEIDESTRDVETEATSFQPGPVLVHGERQQRAPPGRHLRHHEKVTNYVASNERSRTKTRRGRRFGDPTLTKRKERKRWYQRIPFFWFIPTQWQQSWEATPPRTVPDISNFVVPPLPEAEMTQTLPTMPQSLTATQPTTVSSPSATLQTLTSNEDSTLNLKKDKAKVPREYTWKSGHMIIDDDVSSMVTVRSLVPFN